jgi:hypothetical protein
VNTVRSLLVALEMGAALAALVLIAGTLATVAAGRAGDARAHFDTLRLAYAVLLVAILLWPRPRHGHARSLAETVHRFWAWPTSHREFVRGAAGTPPASASRVDGGGRGRVHGRDHRGVGSLEIRRARARAR